jgi:hypothetical protein
VGDTVKKKTIRWGVLLPPMVVIAAIIALNLADYNGFVAVMNATIAWILKHFSWLFNSVSCATVLVVIFAYFSPIKDIRFGGSKARPLLSYANFVWIVLCTIMGSGLMLWTCAEPLYHIYDPPRNVTGGPLSGEALRWAMENILLEWTWTPMAIYAMPTILFAFVFYNMRKPFAIGSMLDPVAGIDKSIQLYNALLSGANMAFALGSYEASILGRLEDLVFCNELIDFLKVLVKGVEISPETLAEDIIDEVGPGQNFLAEEQTLLHYREFWMPDVLKPVKFDEAVDDRNAYIESALKDRVNAILAKGPQKPLSPKIVGQLDGIIAKALSSV